MKKIYLIILLFLIASCTANSTHLKNKNILQQYSSQADIQSHQLGPGDVLEITVYGEKDLSGYYQVSPAGNIMFPLVGKINVSDMDNVALAKFVSEKLADGYIVNPQVSVFVKEFKSKKVFVLGQVKKAGSFSMVTGMNIVEAIALAGGFTDLADMGNIIVTRKDVSGKELRLNIDLSEIIKGHVDNLYLKSGDIIFVPERLF